MRLAWRLSAARVLRKMRVAGHSFVTLSSASLACVGILVQTIADAVEHGVHQFRR